MSSDLQRSHVKPRPAAPPLIFEWHASNCGTYIRDNTYRAPTPLPTVWNIN
ncbi:hypothetical protein [Streptomyces acidiscabies]|uniref:hypothetical protein n=1 Tax=Streptomyces acidiscabies TaxID=42234 RepID=UPI00131A958B|nr:hypothetical protein [Streptomyces acidiscabies]